MSCWRRRVWISRGVGTSRGKGGLLRYGSLWISLRTAIGLMFHGFYQNPRPARHDLSFTFKNKRLCEKWLDNLFMVLYNDLRLYTALKQVSLFVKLQNDHSVICCWRITCRKSHNTRTKRVRTPMCCCTARLERSGRFMGIWRNGCNIRLDAAKAVILVLTIAELVFLLPLRRTQKKHTDSAWINAFPLKLGWSCWRWTLLKETCRERFMLRCSWWRFWIGLTWRLR